MVPPFIVGRILDDIAQVVSVVSKCLNAVVIAVERKHSLAGQ
jgi:hypothetical protein